MDNPLAVVLAVVIAIGVLAYFGRIASRRGRELREQQQSDFASDGKTAPLDLATPHRPKVSFFMLEGDEAVVTFDVPVPSGSIDEVLADLLVSEAVEVLREESKQRDIKHVIAVVAKAGRGDVREVGRRSLEYPGALPPSLGSSHLLQFTKFGNDPIDGQFDKRPSASTSTAPSGSDDLGPIGEGLTLPKAVDVGLRSRGLDPAAMSAGELVRTLLELFGYQVEAGAAGDTYTATKGGQKTFIQDIPHEEGQHPEVEEAAINQFMFDFSASKADRGLLVSDKWGQFVMYEREKRQPNARFITRERLQGFIDALALG